MLRCLNFQRTNMLDFKILINAFVDRRLESTGMFHYLTVTRNVLVMQVRYVELHQGTLFIAQATKVVFLFSDSLPFRYAYLVLWQCVEKLKLLSKVCPDSFVGQIWTKSKNKFELWAYFIVKSSNLIRPIKLNNF